MKTTLLMILFVALLVTACTTTPNTVPVTNNQPNNNVVEENQPPELPPIVVTREARAQKAALLAGYNGVALSGETSFYLQFNMADYDKAIRDDKLIFLNFYSNECTYCQDDNEAALDAFESMDYEDVIGFRVLYNDPALTLDDKDIALKYGVETLNTKIIVKGGKRVFKATDSWSKQTFIDEINRNRG